MRLAALALSLALAHTPFAAAETQKPRDELVIDAGSLVYDKDSNTVSARGDVQIYYKDQILQADLVTYDKRERRVFAEGHVKLTDDKGDVVYATRMELTDDFRDGFIERAQALAVNNSRLSAARVERSGGTVSVAENGTYTACEPCKDHPERPPLWQLRASKVTENQETHTVYYQDAWLDVAGTPIAYVPYFSSPDATVTRKSGFLAPIVFAGTNLGYGVGLPYFFNLAPDYDLTVTPAFLSRQGFFGEAEWRQRLAEGIYSIRVTGIHQAQPGAFLPAPYGAGNITQRGSVETNGKFFLNDKWTFGWDTTWLSDRFYLQDYKIKGVETNADYYRDVVSSIYLRGLGDRGFFDLSAYRFQGVTASDEQRQLPIAAPVFDYDKGFSLSPAATGGIGGEVTLSANMQNITRSQAAFQSTGVQTLDQAYNLYNVCQPGGVNNYNPGACLLRGIAGDYSRLTAEASWQRKFIDPLGEEWKPFGYLRADAESTALNTSSVFTYSSSNGTSVIFNDSQRNFFGGAANGSMARAIGAVGLEYRYPFVSRSDFATQIIQPIAQVVARPNVGVPAIQSNEDAQSLVFDETTLFAWDKYSGFDRAEGGVRFNYGAQYDAQFADGGHANIVAGQSIQVAGLNSFSVPDAANVGLQSGLDQKYSNIVAGETYSPFGGQLTFGSKQQFSTASWGVTRFDLLANLKLNRFWTSLDYGYYGAQPALGAPYPREGFTWNGGVKLTDEWTLDGSLIVDLSRHYFDTPGESTPVFLPVNYSVGLAYSDSCTTFKVRYAYSSQTPSANPIATTPNNTAPASHNQVLVLELNLRTLGDVRGGFGL